MPPLKGSGSDYIYIYIWTSDWNWGLYKINLGLCWGSRFWLWGSPSLVITRCCHGCLAWYFILWRWARGEIVNPHENISIVLISFPHDGSKPLVQDCTMTVEQESFIYCGALFLQLAGLLAKHFTGIYLVSFQMAPHLATSSLGLSHFLRRWKGTFGYISDCSLSCMWPNTEQNWRSEDPGCNISHCGRFFLLFKT